VRFTSVASLLFVAGAVSISLGVGPVVASAVGTQPQAFPTSSTAGVATSSNAIPSVPGSLTGPGEQSGAEASATLSGPTIDVVPSTGLTDGQTVQVNGSGFSASAQIAVGECRSGATSASDCSPDGALVVTADPSGGFTTAFVVTQSLVIGSSTIDCSNPGTCVMGAGQLPSLKTFATTPISFTAVAPPPPPVPTPATRYYLALGDSLATGFGVPTGQGYANDLLAHYVQTDPNLALIDLGCNGETTATFISGGKCTYAQGSQLAAAEAFLSSHQGEVDFVTIDIGGDDITGCASTSPTFSISSSCVTNAVAQANTDLKTIGQALRSAAGPSVPIAGMNYFDPFVIEWLTGSSGQQVAQQSVADLQELNSALAAGYASFGAPVADVADTFSSSDFTDQVSSPYGTVPKNVAVACAWLLVLCEPGGVGALSVHPNATGYSEIALAFEQVISINGAKPPAPSTPLPTLALTGFSGWRPAFVGLALVLLGLLILLGSRRTRRRSPGGRGSRAVNGSRLIP
jgi:lysophospholipase L1-like esterase